MTRVSPPHSGVGPPTSRVGSGTSCQPVGKAPPTGPSSSRDKVGSGADNCPRLHCGVKGREEGAPGGVRRRGALGAPLLPPCPQPGSAGPPRLPPCLRVPILIPRVGGVVYRRRSLGPGRTAARCPLVAAADTAGWWARKAARRAPEERQRPPLGKSTPFQRLGWTLRDPGAPCSASPGPAAPSLTTWSGPGTHRSSRAAQRSRSGGAERVGLQEGCRAHAAPRLPSP